MKILVCIKQVPDMESKFKVDAGGTWYAKTDLAWRMNEYDEYAVEQAVQFAGVDAATVEHTAGVGDRRRRTIPRSRLAAEADGR